MHLLLLLVACSAGGKPLEDGPGRVVCRHEDPKLDESSGLALGSRPGTFWTLEDSGAKPELHAFDQTCGALGRFAVEGAAALDWEDLAGFDLDDERWLLVADTGDNQRQRPEVALYLVREPDLTEAKRTAAVARVIRFRFPDGSHDCEGVAVDPRSRRILLVTKDRGDGTALWELPLDPAQAPVLTATKLVDLELALPGDDAGRKVTAFDLSPDGTRAAVLTYTVAWQWTRRADESWAAAFQRDPEAIPVPDLPQREALAYSADGASLFLTSEGAPMPLVEVPAPVPPPPEPRPAPASAPYPVPATPTVPAPPP